MSTCETTIISEPVPQTIISEPPVPADIIESDKGAKGDPGPAGPPGEDGIEEAPNDGQQYARQSLAWSVVVTGAGDVEEAPEDGTPYSRQDAGWVSSPTGIEEAPEDGTQYARQDAGWSEVAAGGGGAVGPANAIQYTDGAGAFLGDAGLTWDGTTLDASKLHTAGITSPSHLPVNPSGVLQFGSYDVLKYGIDSQGTLSPYLAGYDIGTDNKPFGTGKFQRLNVSSSHISASDYSRIGIDPGTTAHTIAAEVAGTFVTNDVDLELTPANAGKVKFGTHAAVAGETVTGYITIKDSSGVERKLAVLS